MTKNNGKKSKYYQKFLILLGALSLLTGVCLDVMFFVKMRSIELEQVMIKANAEADAECRRLGGPGTICNVPNQILFPENTLIKIGSYIALAVGAIFLESGLAKSNNNSKSDDE